MAKQVLVKLIKRTIEGNTETIVNERIEKELFTIYDLTELIDQFSDDPESAYRVYGLCFNFDDDIALINLDLLCEGLKEYISDNEDDHPFLKQILEKAEPYRAYALNVEG